MEQLSAETPPVVLLDRVFDGAPCDQVGADNRESMRRLVEHLLAQGHRRFVVVAGDTRVPTLIERLAGFRDAAGEAPSGRARRPRGRRQRQIRRTLASRRGRPGTHTCVIAASTPLAVPRSKCLRDAGISVPDDIAFATFDGFNHSDLFQPSITTVRQPAFEMGVAAVSLLLERLASAEDEPTDHPAAAAAGAALVERGLRLRRGLRTDRSRVA